MFVGPGVLRGNASERFEAQKFGSFEVRGYSKDPSSIPSLSWCRVGKKRMNCKKHSRNSIGIIIIPPSLIGTVESKPLPIVSVELSSSSSSHGPWELCAGLCKKHLPESRKLHTGELLCDWNGAWPQNSGQGLDMHT